MNDEKTINAIAAQDEAAISEVISKYSKLLWYVVEPILSRAGSTEDMEECVADTFIYLWEHSEKYDPRRGKLKTWLCLIARSKALDKYHEILKCTNLPLDEVSFINQLGIIDGILQQDRKNALIKALETLKQEERDILIRRYYYEQKPREIASALGISKKQVDNRLYCTKQKLRKVIDG